MIKFATLTKGKDMSKKEIIKYLLVTCVIFTIFVLAGSTVDDAFVITEVQNSFIQFLPAIVAGASAIFGAIQGGRQRRQASQLEAQNVRPTFRQSAELRENQALARQQSRIGLPDQVYNNQLNQLQQNMVTGLRQLGSRGNLPYNVNAMVRGTNQATANLNAQDAQYRLQGQQNLMSANRALAGEDRAQFQDQMNQYQFNAQNVANMRRAGWQNTYGALSMLGQGALMGSFNSLQGVFGQGGGVNNMTLPPQQMNPMAPTTLGQATMPQTLPYRNFLR